jgi:Fe-S cluster assembly protein SufB
MADLDTIELVKDIEVDKYKYGFTTDIESDFAPKGLNDDIVKFISPKANLPDAGMAPGSLSPLAADG